MTERVNNPIFARVFSALVASPLGKGMEKDRRRLVDGLRGRVVEVGAGTGANFAFYPPEVDEVVAVEPEPYLRGKAEKAAAGAPVKVTVQNGTAASLPLPNGSVDAGVVSLVLCSVPSVEAAIAELYRVIRPGGELRFYEHVKAPSGVVTPRLQRLLDATVWPRMSGGCHTARDPVPSIERAGFTIESLKRLDFRVLGMETPVSPHVAGIARRP